MNAVLIQVVTLVIKFAKSSQAFPDLLSWVREWVLSSETKLDDALVIPLLNAYEGSGNGDKTLLAEIFAIIGGMIRDKDTQDQLLDKIEDWVADTNTPVDDWVVLPVIQGYRSAFGVPDND